MKNMIDNIRKHIRSLLNEARVVKTLSRRNHQLGDLEQYVAEQPLKKGETIRVYHGFHRFHDAINTAMYGLSGKKDIGRIFSYESGNNPKGLFVTLNFDTAKEFVGVGSPSVIIEFHTKYDDLESPVWAGKGAYFVQGEYTQSFRNEKERKEAQMQARELAKKNTDERISQSDNPEVADWLFGGENQALFIGDLNPNSIRAFWVQDSNRYDAPYTRYSRQQFIKKFVKPELADIKKKQQEKNQYGRSNWNYGEGARKDEYKVFLPREDWDKEEFIKRIMKGHGDDAKETVEEWLADPIRNLEYIAEYLHPKQLDQLYGKDKWRNKHWYGEDEE